MPTLWGYSGHLQTVFHSIVGRVKCPWPSGDRIYLSLDDNSTLTYDLYQPLNEPNGMLNTTTLHLFTYLSVYFTFNVPNGRIRSIAKKMWNDIRVLWPKFHVIKICDFYCLEMRQVVKRPKNESNIFLHSHFICVDQFCFPSKTSVTNGDFFKFPAIVFVIHFSTILSISL